MDRSTALDRIREVVGTVGVVSDASAVEKYLIDERHLYRGAAALVTRPGSVVEISRVLEICNAARLGVVPQGGNTGYCGGATPMSATDQILVSLERLNEVRRIDPIGFTMTAEAGVVLQHAQQAAAEKNLLFPLSMGSEGSCQIGGNLSTNAGGLAVLRYGTARELVLGLEVVLPDGTVLEGLKGLRKDNTGFDLKALFMGAEGTLGIITAAVLKLYPESCSRETAWLAIADSQAAGALLGVARRESGDSVTSLEYVSRQSLELVLQHVEAAGNPLGDVYEHQLLIELSSGQSTDELRATVERIVEQGMAAGLILDGVIAESGPQRQRLWRLRESIPEAEKRAGGSIKHDISVAIGETGRYIEMAPSRLLSRPAPRISVYGHAGDGNLHYNLLAPADTDPAEFQSQWADTLSDAVHALAAELGGSFSAEHGIGQLKRPTLAKYKNAADLALMRRLKTAIDPNGIMNPGKII